MQMACFVFIQRRWEDDRKHMESMLGYFCDIREPLQLLLFPEGTDLTGNVFFIFFLGFILYCLVFVFFQISVLSCIHMDSGRLQTGYQCSGEEQEVILGEADTKYQQL